MEASGDRMFVYARWAFSKRERYSTVRKMWTRVVKGFSDQSPVCTSEKEELNLMCEGLESEEK